MSDIPRLNGVIKALEAGQTAFVAFTPVDIENAIAMAGTKLDGVAFEMRRARAHRHQRGVGFPRQFHQLGDFAAVAGSDYRPR